MLAELSAGAGSPASLGGFLRLRQQALWRHAGSLWRSTGGAGSGAVLFTAGTGSSTPINLQGRALWAEGANLFTSDGTAAGTSQSGSLEPFTSGVLTSRGVVNGKAVFVRTDQQVGQEPGVTDGTSAGTMLLKNINNVAPGLGSSPAILGTVDDWVLFTAVGDAGPAIWRTDGTPAGTQPVKVINPAISGVVNGRAAFLDGVMYFVADDGVHGKELWRSDGTESGTFMVKDVEPNPTSNSAAVRHVYRVNRSIVFVADDGIHGAEPWISDGTTQGTRLWIDLVAGPAGSQPSAFIGAGGRAFMVADAPGAGHELHATSLLQPGRTTLEWCSVVQTGLADLSAESFEIELPALSASIVDVDLSLVVSHSRVSDLRVTLAHAPSGISAVLVNDLTTSNATPCHGDNLNARLDDEATDALQDRCSDGNPAYPRRTRLAPSAALAAFDGRPMSGPWTLTIEDKAAVATGTLHEWCLHFTGTAILRDGFE